VAAWAFFAELLIGLDYRDMELGRNRGLDKDGDKERTDHSKMGASSNGRMGKRRHPGSEQCRIQLFMLLRLSISSPDCVSRIKAV
jgi:hypothetical protein